jgi:predicted metal-binding membrane protein
MNLYWILGLAVLVLVEKVLPVGPRTASVIGVLLAVWGGALMLSVAI